MSALLAPDTASCPIPSTPFYLSISCPIRANSGVGGVAIPADSLETSP